jgi:chromosome-anchoring protein RacA
MVEILVLKMGGTKMNTSEVAKFLGVSASTIQRWVKQLGLPMDRNERGHYLFKPEDIELLKNIKEQIQNGALLQDIIPTQDKKTRKGAVKTVENDKALTRLFTKVRELEISLDAKADSVASYQLLQHRRELEEMQNQIIELTLQLEAVQKQVNELQKPSQIENPPLLFDSSMTKRKKKTIVRSLFGF